jgi:pimeloyl-ACP methyl ester carboxylesterase
MTADSTTLSVVLVHGAFATSASWSKVLALLNRAEIPAVAAHCPLTSLAHDAAAAQRAVEMQPGRVLLVGHAWGGAVITEAGRHPKVAGLVYVAAVAPDSGQCFNDCWADHPPAEGSAEIRPYGDGFVALTPKGFRESYAPDLAEAEAAALFATQAPLAIRCFLDRIGTAAWRSKPAWCLVAEEDRMIPPAVERASAARLQGGNVVSLRASHAPILSQSDAVAHLVTTALKTFAP